MNNLWHSESKDALWSWALVGKHLSSSTCRSTSSSRDSSTSSQASILCSPTSGREHHGVGVGRRRGTAVDAPPPSRRTRRSRTSARQHFGPPQTRGQILLPVRCARPPVTAHDFLLNVFAAQSGFAERQRRLGQTRQTAFPAIGKCWGRRVAAVH